ncbi:MAG: diguanylate cyclase [Sulfurimonas sp.]|nr:diguanylate cyclase [Sulfurimonas sp.]
MKQTLFFKLLFLSIGTLLCASSSNLEKVTLELQWKNQFQFAGYYIAKEKGFYKEQGLDVTLNEFSDAINPVDKVLGSEATYGTGRSSLVKYKSDGGDINILSAIFQSSPLVLLTLPSSNITKLEDFKNKTVMIAPDDSTEVSVMAMLSSVGLYKSDINFVKYTFSMDDLVKRQVDGTSAYVSTQPFELNSMGIKPITFDPKNYGFDFYNDILFTSTKETIEHPNRVARFQKASLRGWRYAFEHIEEAVELILKKYNTQSKSRKELIFEAKTLKKLAYYKTDMLGKIDKHKVKKIYDIYNVMGFVKNPIDIDEFIFDTKEAILSLTSDEREYIKNHKIIKMCNNPSYEPIEFIYQNNPKDIRGIAIDTIKLIEKQLGVKFVRVPTKSWKESQQFLKDKKCDILPAAVKNSTRVKYANFTNPYLKLPLAIVTRKDNGFVSSFNEMHTKTMARHKSSGMIQILKNKYPHIKIKETKNTVDTFSLISQKKADFTLASMPVLSNIITKYKLDNLQIAGYTDMVYNLGIAVENDNIILLNILNKSLKQITTREHAQISKKWTPQVIKEKIIDYDLMIEIGLLGFIIVLLSLYWSLKVSKVNKELGVAKKELEVLVSTDFLTKLHNRRHLYEAVPHLIAASKRDAKNLSLVMLDIDKFKNINDKYGHDVGDDVIVLLAQILQEFTRKSDIVFRWGGEEFLVILLNTSAEGGYIISEKIRSAIENIAVDVGNSKTLHFTVSAGVTSFKYDKDKDIDSTIKRADNGLYMAKTSGRNKVCLV